MSNPIQLSEEEIATLVSYKDSELYRVYLKAIEAEFYKATQILLHSPAADVVRVQGMLQGITACKNMIGFYSNPDVKKITKITK